MSCSQKNAVSYQHQASSFAWLSHSMTRGEEVACCVSVIWASASVVLALMFIYPRSDVYVLDDPVSWFRIIPQTFLLPSPDQSSSPRENTLHSHLYWPVRRVRYLSIPGPHPIHICGDPVLPPGLTTDAAHRCHAAQPAGAGAPSRSRAVFTPCRSRAVFCPCLAATLCRV